MNIDYSVNNEEIQELLSKRIITYALQIQCLSTWYREIKISDSNSQTLFIPSNAVHERVDSCPCIIALKDIDNFSNIDFSEDFEGISFWIAQRRSVGNWRASEV